MDYQSKIQKCTIKFDTFVHLTIIENTKFDGSFCSTSRNKAYKRVTPDLKIIIL